MEYISMRKRHILWGILGVLIIILLLGPKADYPAFSAKISLPEMPVSDLDVFIQKRKLRLRI